MSRPQVAKEGVSVIGQRSVLIVDPSEETREVLQTALERRGVRILATGQVKRGRELAQRHQPDLIVLDVESACGAGVPPAFPGAGETPAPQDHTVNSRRRSAVTRPKYRRS